MKIFLILAVTLSVIASFGKENKKSISTYAESGRIDLEHIRKTLRENHPGELMGKEIHYNKWKVRGYIRAKNLMEKVSKKEDAYVLLNAYMNGFRSTHTNLSAETNFDHVWAGFFLKKRGKRIWTLGSLVDEKADLKQKKYFKGLKPSDFPPKDSELVSCDGKGIGQLVSKKVYSPLAKSSVTDALVAREAPLLFYRIDDNLRKRPKECIFKKNGKKFKMTLAWRKFPLSEFANLPRPFLKKVAGHIRGKIGVKSISKKTKVYTIPTFNTMNQGDDFVDFDNSLGEIVDGRPYTQDTNLVFDLRSNKGGSASGPDVILAGLSLKVGEQIYKCITNSEKEYERITQKNMSLKNETYSKKMTGSPLDKITKKVIKDRNEERLKALKEGKQFLGDAPGEVTNILSGNFKKPSCKIDKKSVPRFYLVTNHRCASACITMIDRLKLIDSTVLIGEPTKMRDIFYDSVKEILPSKNFSLVYPVSAIANPVVKMQYKPDIYLWTDNNLSIEDILDKSQVDWK